MKAANESCTMKEMIDNEDECESAVRYLNIRGANLTFYGNESSEENPHGCYNIENYTDVYWNTHSSGTANEHNNQICKLICE